MVTKSAPLGPLLVAISSPKAGPLAKSGSGVVLDH